MKEVRDPGSNSKLASMPFVFQIETWATLYRFFCVLSLPPATWK